MKAHIDRLDTGLRMAVLLGAIVIIYAGPASAIGMEHIFGDDLGGTTSGSEMMAWMGFVWLFAIPLVLAAKWWNSNPAGSTVALSVFLTLMLLIWMVTRSFGLFIMTAAIAAPFQAWDEIDSNVGVYYIAAVILTSLICIAIPVTAIAFQLLRYHSWVDIRE